MVFRAVRGSEDRRWSYSRGGIISGRFKFGALIVVARGLSLGV